VKEISQRCIAEALGMSAAAISKFVRRGMPIGSVEAARAWHRAYVRPRMSDNPARRYADELAQVDGLWPLARAAMAAGRLDVIRPALSAALRAVPHEARHLVSVDPEVADELVAPVLQIFRDNTEPSDRSPMTEEDVNVMSKFWFALMAEEPDAFDHLEPDAPHS